MIRRVLAKEVIINGNPRVYKALRKQLDSVLLELRRLERLSEENDELISLVRYIAEILNGIKGDSQ